MLKECCIATGHAEYPQRLVASAVRALLKGEDANCGNADLVRDYLHTADIAGAFVALLESDIEGAINVGSGQGVRLGDIILKIGERLGAKERVKLSTRPSATAGQPDVLIANTARLAATGWKPSFDLDDGLADTIAWWRPQKNIL